MASTAVGQMRETLVIQQRSVVADSHGGRVVTFSTLDTVPAALVDNKAGENLQVEQIQASVNYRFRIRARTDLAPGMRALWRPSWSALSTPKTLEIHGVPPFEGGRQWQVLECGEIAAAA